MNNKHLKEELIRVSGVNPRKCMTCGKCSATCPAFAEMEYHPHQFVSMVEKGQIEKLMESDSIYMCLSCMACVERCPRGVEPGKLVEAVRVLKTRQQDQNRKNGNDIAAFADENTPQQLFMAAMRKYRK